MFILNTLIFDLSIKTLTTTHRVFSKIYGSFFTWCPRKNRGQEKINEVTKQHFDGPATDSTYDLSFLLEKPIEEKAPVLKVSETIDGKINTVLKKPLSNNEIIAFNRHCIKDYGLISQQLMMNFEESQKHLNEQRDENYQTTWEDSNKKRIRRKRKCCTGKALLVDPKIPGFERQTLEIPELGAGYTVGCVRAQGRRDEMQDMSRHGVLTLNTGDKKKVGASYFAVFDGHGGNECARFLYLRIATYLQKILNTVCHCKKVDQEKRIYNDLMRAGVFLSEEYLKLYGSNNRVGSTAIIILKLGNVIWTGCAGDSRAFFIEDQAPFVKDETYKVIALSEDADPSNPRYIQEVQKLGGWVEHTERLRYRVRHINSSHRLNMTSAIGHSEINSGISPLLKITKFTIKTKGHLVLLSDGITEVASTNQIAAKVKEILVFNRKNKLPTDPEEIASEIVKEAFNVGSEDNMTVMVAAF